VVLKQFKE